MIRREDTQAKKFYELARQLRVEFSKYDCHNSWRREKAISDSGAAANVR